MSKLKFQPIGNTTQRRSSTQTPLDMDAADPVYSDNCLVCNQLCLFQVNSSGNYEDRSLPSTKAALELRQVLYKAFEIGVDPLNVVNSEDEDGCRIADLPLCTVCTFKVGQLKGIQSQLEALEKEYRKMRRVIAFSIVDIVASNSDADLGMSLAEFNSQPTDVIVGKMREYEVETLQQLIFEKWHEASYDDDEVEEQEPLIPIVNIHEPKTHQISPSILKQGSSKTTDEKTAKTSIPSSSKMNNDNGKSKTTLISITTKKDGVNVKQYSPRRGEGSNAIVQQIYQRLNFRPEQSQLKVEDEEYAIDEEVEEYEHGESSLEDEQLELDTPETILGLRASSSGGTGYPEVEVTEWSDESQERITDYDGEVDDDTLREFGMPIDEESLPALTVRRRRSATADSDAGMQNIDFQQNEDGLFVCMYCSKTFIHKYPFRDHVKTHTGEGPKCPICGKIFPKRHNLMLHLRTHTGEKPYSCAVCSKGFADKSNLKVHMRVHTGERPYKCDYCDQAFVNSSRLVVHKRSHSGEKPHECDICNKAFATSNQLSSHRKVHFDIKKPFSCEECGKGFSNNTTLTAHLGSFHGLGR